MAKVTLDADTFKALASATRLTVLRALDERRKTLTELARDLDLNKATVHEHLQLLLAADLVKKRDDEGRKWIYYELTWRGQKLLHPQETTTFNVLLGLGLATAGGGTFLLFQTLHRIWNQQPALLSEGQDPTRPDGLFMAESKVSEDDGRLSAAMDATDPGAGSQDPTSPPSDPGAPTPSSPPSSPPSEPPANPPASPPPSPSPSPSPSPAPTPPDSPPATGPAPPTSPPPDSPTSPAPPAEWASESSESDGFPYLMDSDDSASKSVADDAGPGLDDFFGRGGWIVLAVMAFAIVFVVLASILRRRLRGRPADPAALEEDARERQGQQTR